MTLIKNKLKSQNGASILLAILLLLLCIMVGSSIMAAAMSNAGKSKGNQEAQQEYFMVKSAIELVCGELERMQYAGRYNYSGKKLPCHNLHDPDPLNVDHLPYEYYELAYVMQQGILSGTVNLPTQFKDNLLGDLDRLHSVPFYKAYKASAASDEGIYRRSYSFAERLGPRLVGEDVAAKQTDAHDFTIQINNPDASFPGFASNKTLSGKKVDVRVEIIESDLSLKITAEIQGTGSNKMEALMKPKNSFKAFTVPMDSLLGDGGAAITDMLIYNDKPPLSWTVEYIRKAIDR